MTMNSNSNQLTPNTAPENPTRRILFKNVLRVTAALVVVQSLPSYAKEKKLVYTKKGEGLALRGYDAVAYFTANKPVKGKKKYATEYKGATWHFSSQENVDAFVLNPESYEPQYGGYCAYSVSVNKLVKANPKLWKIINDKLYVNYNRNIHKRWLKRPDVMIERADSHWPTVLS